MVLRYGITHLIRGAELSGRRRLAKPRKGVSLLKQNSRAKIALCLRTHGPLSKAQISRMTGLSITCVCDTANELVSEGALVETGTIAGPRGRPMVLLTINPNGSPVAGVRLAPEAIEIAVATPTIDVLARRVISYDPLSQSIESTVDAIADAIRRCAAAADTDVSALSGVGIAVHGMVDPVLGVIEEMTNRPGWEQVPITRMIEERLQLPVVADNCVRAGAITYQWFNSERRAGGTLYLAIAEGVGAALMYDQEIARGIHHSGNQLGHVIIDPDGPLCACGNHGCLEAFCSDLSFARRLWPDVVRAAVDMTFEQREGLVRRGFELARAGDEKAVQALDDVIDHLGIGIANGVALFGSRTIIVLGTLIDLAPSLIVDEIRKAALKYVHERDRGIEIRAALNCREFLLRGAIGLVLCRPYRELREESLSLGQWEGPHSGTPSGSTRVGG